MIAHVRGVAYHPRVTVGEQNLHPFQFAGAKLAMAHNGDLYQFDRMKLALIEHVKPEIANQIRGNTDSEWIYALLLSQLDAFTARPTAREILRGLERTLRILRRVREAHGIQTSSSVNPRSPPTARRLWHYDSLSILAVIRSKTPHECTRRICLS